MKFDNGFLEVWCEIHTTEHGNLNIYKYIYNYVGEK